MMLIDPPIIHNSLVGKHVPPATVLSQLCSKGVHAFIMTEMVPIALLYCSNKLSSRKSPGVWCSYHSTISTLVPWAARRNHLSVKTRQQSTRIEIFVKARLSVAKMRTTITCLRMLVNRANGRAGENIHLQKLRGSCLKPEGLYNLIDMEPKPSVEDGCRRKQ